MQNAFGPKRQIGTLGTGQIVRALALAPRAGGRGVGAAAPRARGADAGGLLVCLVLLRTQAVCWCACCCCGRGRTRARRIDRGGGAFDAEQAVQASCGSPVALLVEDVHSKV